MKHFSFLGFQGYFGTCGTDNPPYWARIVLLRWGHTGPGIHISTGFLPLHIGVSAKAFKLFGVRFQLLPRTTTT